MPVFEYKGRDASGQLIDGSLEGNDINTIAAQLSAQGIIPVNIQAAAVDKQQPSPLDNVLDRLRRKKPQPDDLILFSRQMYTLMRAGVPIIRAISGLAESTRNIVLQETLRDVIASLEAGRELSASMSQHPDVFSTLMVSMMQLGEATGRLDDVFLQLSEYLGREKTTRDQVKSALRYPMFVITAITIAMIIINIWVIPTFAKVFAGFNAELPLPTQILLNISDFMVAYWWLLLGLVLLAFIVFKKYINTKSGRYTWDRLNTRWPVFGDILLRATLSRFSRAFAMTQRAGVPLIQGLVVVSHAVDNTFIEKNIQDMRTGIERGDSLSRTAVATEMFTPLVLQMLTVGEETGAVDEMMEQVADFYDREVDYDLKNITSAIEPILIIAIGGMVLVLALGVFLPMWDLIGAAKH